MSDDQKRIALVTGASRGIGRAILKALLDKGYVVAGTATSEKGAAAIADFIKEHGGANSGKGYVLNVADADSVSNCIGAVQKELGPVSVLVNNAGITKDNLLMRMNEGEWLDVMNTNLSSVYRTSKACLRGMMKARFGRIINISSIVASMGNPGQTNYASTKAGVEGFTRSLAKEVGSRNITVNAVAPGFIATDMTDALSEDQQKVMFENIPLARFGQADEVAALVAFLASDQAAYITGETIQINGGLYMA